jgi:hypothetical protein
MRTNSTLTYSKNLPVFALNPLREQVDFSPFSLKAGAKKEKNQVFIQSVKVELINLQLKKR